MKDGNNILALLLEQIKHILEKMHQEKRRIWLEIRPETKGNGCYARHLQLLCGQLEGIRVPRSRDGGFKRELLPYRRRTIKKTPELLRALIMAGVSTRKIGEVFKQLYGMQISPTTVSQLAQIAEQEIKAWRYRPLLSWYAVIQLDAVFVPLRRDRVEPVPILRQKEAVSTAWATQGDGHRKILGYWLPGGSESADDWREILQELQHRGVQESEFIVADG